MTAALSAEQRTALEKLVQHARRWIEDDLEHTLGGTYGINADGRIEDEGSLSLSNTDAAVRADLVEMVEFLRSEGEGEAGSVARLVREAAFTHTNRLIAVRVAEGIGLLPETMARGVSSSGFRDFSELAPTVATTDWGRFAEFVRLCADEMAADVPALFDPRNPLLELAMSETVLAKVIDAIAALDDDLWAAPDALGWAYQFFNTGEERREMRESSAPRSSRELAVRNQFFTPSYVVEFLVHNGLGAHLVACFPDLADELPLLVEVPTEQIEVDLEAVRVLDPACGSGHFLLGAYDVLEKAWQHAGVEPGDAAPAIVRSLWGIDIDPRATQIAQAAVMFRARRHCRGEKLPGANVICARALPVGPEADALIASLPERVGRAVRGIADELVDAPILGPLLKIEERLSREVRDVFGTGVVEGTLSEGAGAETDNVEAEVLDALSAIADSTTSSAAQRLFAAEAHDAVRFVQAMARRYTAVLMNPPFGTPVPASSGYLESTYAAPYSELACHFVERGLDLASPATGSVAAITTRAPLFLKTYEKWRKATLFSHGLMTLADLGFGIMEQAMVEAAAYVIGARRSDRTPCFLRLMREKARPQALASTVTAARNRSSDDRVFRRRLEDFKALNRAPLAYWAPEVILGLLRDGPFLEAEGRAVRRGSWPGDDFRHLRLWWELEVHSASLRQGWPAYAKGGPYAPFIREPELCVAWDSSRGTFKDFYGRKGRPSEKPEAVEYFFKGGLTWTRRTNSGLSFRVLPKAAAFADKGPAVAVEKSEQVPTLALFLNSRLVQAIVDLFMAAADETTSSGASRSYEAGVIKTVPLPSGLLSSQVCNDLATRTINASAQMRAWEETSRYFSGLPSEILSAHTLEAAQRALVFKRNRLFTSILETTHEFESVLRNVLPDKEVHAFVDDVVGRHPLDYDTNARVSDDQIAHYLEMNIDDAVDLLIDMAGGARSIANLMYLADRRIEVLAHGLRVNAHRVIAVEQERERWDPELRLAVASDVVSFVLGCAFGRWQAPSSAGVSQSLSLFGPLPSSPPAMGNDPTVASLVAVNQRGAPNDLALRMRQAAVAEGIQPLYEESLQEVAKRGSPSRYINDGLFADHLSRYTMHRRKAPIYWQLQVPSKTWGVWLYAPKLSREMLFAIVREAEQRQRLAKQQIGHLQREAETGSGGRKVSEVAKELEAEQKLAVELETFRAEAERIANLGWDPDLDDGMVLNAAPLADLFPAWGDAAKYRKGLRAGKYEWATVARYADQL
jgi:hypothetical protein